MSGGELKSIGRELAVEALIDMHDRGPAYRVGKIMDEAPAAAMSSRPVQVTRQMLLERAKSLSKYENKGEYLDFPRSQNDGFSTPKSKGPEKDIVTLKIRRERIMRHHAKIIKAKNTVFRAKLHKGATASVTNSAHPPSQLVSSLRKIYGSESLDRKESSGASNILPGLLQSIFEHEVITREDQARTMAVGAKEEIPRQSPQITSPVANIETIVGNACTLEDDNDQSLQGLLIAAMSVLTTCILNTPIHEESIHGSDESADSNVYTDSLHNGLQVSGPLSLVFDCLQDCSVLDDLGGDSFNFDRDLMQYFRDASAIYEERIDIQKTAIVSARERSVAEKRKNAAMKESSMTRNARDSFENIDDEENDMPGLMQRRFGDDISSSDESVPFSDESSDSEQEIEDANSTGGGGVGGNMGDGDMERPLLQVNHSSSSDSDDDEEVEEEEEDMDDAERENEAYLLEEALAMSLAELNSAISAVANQSENETADGRGVTIEAAEAASERNSQSNVQEQAGANNDPESEGTSFEIKAPSRREYHSSSASEETVPSLPTPPSQEIYRSLWDIVGMNLESDNIDKLSHYMDPSTLADYGKLPPSNIFIVLLRVIVSKVEKRKRSTGAVDDKHTTPEVDKNKNLRRRELETMLRELSFGEETVKPEKNEVRDDLPFSDDDLHLIIASVHILANSRLEIFDHLCDEFRSNDSNFSHMLDSNASSGDEYNTDDPAFAIGTENTSGIAAFESLEEKGMVRKAAAAAHTAAVRREINQQKIEALCQVLHLLSIGSYLMLRCLRLLFQEIALQQGNLELKSMSSLARLRLSTSLTTFTSASIADKCHERLSELSLSVEDRDKVFHALSPKALMIESSALWGECAPNLMMSRKILDQQLRHTFEAAFCKDARESLSSFRGLDQQSGAKSDLNFPWCDADEQLLKLGSLCKRIQTADVLSVLVPRPMCGATSSIDDSFQNLSATIAILGKEISKGLDCSSCIAKDIENCYYALCHRFNEQVLLWGGALSTSNDSFGEKSQDSQEKSGIGSNLRTVKDPDLAFDAAKCADSIALLPSPSGVGFSVNQRANKVWGTVLSTKYFKPKSGVHRWAVKLDKCERGHIFIGVGTARTSTKTYVGGDKNGWGVIGTQALWHDRKKIRSDYGRTFRTGAVIVVTMDTDAGTLGFSLWNENESEASSSSPLKLSDLNNSEKNGDNGVLEDWGVAFEGLPLDTRLFPAVGMYQRDDKATLIALEKNDIDAENDTNFQSGSCFFPQESDNGSVRQWNSEICNEGIVHATNIMNEAIGMLTNEERGSNVIERTRMFQTILPSIASCISLFPSTIPILSGRAAFNLLPHVLKCITVIEKNIEQQSKTLTPTFPINSGRWTIRATNTSNTSASGTDRFEEEYVVNLEASKFQRGGQFLFGSGTGTTGASEGKSVSIHGSCRGNIIYFVEKWLDGSNSNESPSLCTVEARLHLDGTQFEGKYQNGNHDTSGMIVGIHESRISVKPTISDAFNSSAPWEAGLQEHLVQCSYLLGLAVGHLTLILDRGAPTRDIHQHDSTSCHLISKRRSDLSKLLISSPILTRGLSDDNLENSFSRMEDIRELYRMAEGKLDSSSSQIISSWYNETKHSLSVILESEESILDSEESDLTTKISISDDDFDRIDALMVPQAGGLGSLSSLHSSYNDARKSVIKVLLQHTGWKINPSTTIKESHNDFVRIWSSALQIVEARVRKSIMKPGPGKSRVNACQSCCNFIQMLSTFLLEISHPSNPTMFSPDEFKELYQDITTKDELSYLRRSMEELSQKGVLKLIGLKTIKSIIGSRSCSVSTRETMLIGFHRLMDQKYSTQNSIVEPKFTLSGSYGMLQRTVLYIIKDTFFEIKGLAKEVLEMSKTSQNDAFLHPTVQSLLLAMFMCFFSPIRNYEEILNDKVLWDLMKYVFSNSLHDLKDRDLNKREFSQSTMPNLSKWILTSSCKHTNLDLLQSSVSLLHAILFQLPTKCTEFPQIVTKPLSLLKTEILYAMKCLQEKEKEIISEHKYQIASLECDRWNGIAKESPLREVKTSSVNTGDKLSIGFPGVQGLRIISLSSYLSHLFNALNTFIGNQNNQTEFHDDIQFLKHLIHFVVRPELLDTSRRLRIRILRLLRRALCNCAADKEIVSSLINHVSNALESASHGNDFSSADANDCMEAKETISLIRYLYSTSYENNVGDISWQDMILDTYMQSSEEAKASLCAIFGGMPGLIAPGSFVLLKPLAAKNLQTTTHLKSSSETRSVGGSLSPVAGCGIEGIVSGLCRKEAKGGIICKIDETTSTCEVVLFEREDNSSTMTTDESISVRAMRVPFSDITAADEIGFLFDETFPVSSIGTEPLHSHLLGVLSDLNKPRNNFDETVSAGSEEAEGTSHSALASFLRSNILILSDPSLIRKFVKDEKSRGCLSKILELAALTSLDSKYPVAKSVRGQSLKALPEFEARYWHLKSLEAGIRERRNAIISSKAKLCEIYQDINHSEDEPGTEPLELRVDENIPNSQDVSNPDFIRETSVERRGQIAESTENESISGSHNDASEEDDEDDNDEEENDASDDDGRNRSEENEELAHLREAAIVQMLELGLPRSWSEYALRRVGGTNIEAAVHFCLERGGDMERLLTEDHERSRGPAAGSIRRRNTPGASQLLQQLIEMGFPPHWCTEALAATRQNVDEALTWILTNGERLSALDEGDNDADDDSNSEGGEENESSDDDVDATVLSTKTKEEDTMKKQDAEEDLRVWPDTLVCPVRSISGRANIDLKTLDVGGLPSGGFSSVGTKGVLLTEGKWYYECVLVTSGCIQVGWADSSFSGHCQADRGDGCGDGPSSWAYDGWRRYRWHNNATEWGCRWQDGDVVGCLVDMDRKEMSFTLNGRGEEVGMGLAFSPNGFKPCGGVYACVSFNRREKVRLVIGGSEKNAFHFAPPPGYKAVGEAVVSAVDDLDLLLAKEKMIGDTPTVSDRKPYICDFSDTEHGHEIFAWQHRYYGSDASVHLGVGRQRQNPGTSQVKKSLKSLIYRNGSKSGGKGDCKSTLDLLLSEVWKTSSIHVSKGTTFEKRLELVLHDIDKSYEVVLNDVAEEFRDVSLALCMFYARKVVMHIAISMSSSFQLSWFCQGIEAETARRFVTVLEQCCSLSSEGWVGEAGTMSMASEALGLAISSNDRISQQRNFSGLIEGRKRVESDASKMKNLITGATTQVLNVVNLYETNCGDSRLIDPSNNLAACAEGVLGGEGVGAIIFIKDALQAAVVSSKSVVDVLLAYISRSVRVLSNIEFQDDELGGEKTAGMDAATESSDSVHTSPHEKIEEREPDARLTSFLTGLLISGPILNSSYGDEISQTIANSLCEAWTTGLISQSVPWRMISAMTITSLLNICPPSWDIQPSKIIPLRRFFRRLNSITSRRIWAERAALPVCSRFLQSLIDLQSSVNRFPSLYDTLPDVISVDAATPSPLKYQLHSNMDDFDLHKSWEANEGWVCSDRSWEVWTGAIEYFAVGWSAPPRTAVRSLMDGGDGPPLLREGCTVLRGLDWDDDGSGTLTGKEDGKEVYDLEKSERKKTKRKRQKSSIESSSSPEGQDSDDGDNSPPEEQETDKVPESSPTNESANKKKKLPLPNLPLGRVISIEPWKGVPGVARRVRWDLTGEESIYRFGADGGKFDIVHVEVNDKATRVVKRHPHSETAEQCAVRHGFGVPKTYNILLRIRKSEIVREEFDSEIEHICDGILELPDFGAGIEVSCRFHEDGAVTITEGDLIFGTKDSGWEARFGQPTFVPGTKTVLSATAVTTSPFLKEDGIPEDVSADLSIYEELLGSSSFSVKSLRNRDNGERVRVASEMRLVRGKCFSTDSEGHSTVLPPLLFDSDWHAPSLSVSRDQRTVTCASAEGRSTAFLSAGFSKGVHYWEVKIEQADVGSVYIGVAEKPKSSTSGTSSLNRWLGWGFVNFRATYNEGSERVYGSHCHAGDTIGILLDCDSGRLSFFFDGVKYGEHILNDLGCAFENISPFGFNADGCGGGGAGQGAPSGEGGRGGRYPANGTVRPKALWPVIGLRHPGDRVTISHKWMTNYGVDGSTMLRNALLVDEVLQSYGTSDEAIKVAVANNTPQSSQELPKWLVQESFLELKRWEEGKWSRIETRANGPMNLSSFGLNIDIDVSPFACAAACASLGLKFVILQGDRVSIKRSAGRILELPEEAVILGSFLGKLWYKIVSQKSEGGSLKEGGGRAWFWDESEVADGGLQLLESKPVNKIAMPLLDRFKCTASLRVTYSSGAVMRSDIEILENVSQNIGVIPYETVIPREDIIERRMNSNGLVRFLVKYVPVGIGWISYRIRGGTEESVLELVDEKDSEAHADPYEYAKLWFEQYEKLAVTKVDGNSNAKECWAVESFTEFQDLLNDGIVPGLTCRESDSLLSQIVTSIADHTVTGSALNCPYEFFCPAIFHALKAHDSLHQSDVLVDCLSPHSASHQAAASKIGVLSRQFPPMKALLARVAMLRALNRRTQYAMPLYSIRPPQEDSGIVGGLGGFGASVERLGKSRHSASFDNWVQTSSIGRRVRECRELIFTSVKRDILNSIVEVTTTPTSLSHDEYELPRDIRTVRVNRLKARKAIEASEKNMKKENTVFGQLQTELRGWSGSALRRGYIAKGHGGQKRAFKVKLIGEGVNDYSGPYREVFTDAMREVNRTRDSLESVLGILKPSPNNDIDVGENRNLSVFVSVEKHDVEEKCADTYLSDEESIIRSHYSSHIIAKSEQIRNQEDSLAFLGKLVGTAVRHGIPVDLDLPLGTVWKRLCEEDASTLESLKEIDLIEYRRLKENASSVGNGSPLLMKQQRMFNAFAEGLSGILPVEVFSIFTGVELRDYFCGNKEIDVELLRKVVEYEGYEEDDAVIAYFWETLREMTTDEKKLFLQFVWARSRMPLKESDFDAPFKIQKGTQNSSALPSASTCFFSLSLPEYESKEILREKLLFAINNVTTMESDYVTNDVEIGEGWRDL